MPPRHLLTSLVLILTLGACAPVWYGVDVVWIHRAPPPPRREYPSVVTGDGWIWLSGYWYWTGITFVWRPGFWSRPPVPGHVWVRDGWIHREGRYQYVPGRWSRPELAPRHRYVTRPWPRAYRPVPVPRPPVPPRHRPHPGRDDRPRSEQAQPRAPS